MSDISITTVGTALTVRSPYNTDLVEGAKDLGGRFDAATKAWVFDARDERRVRDLLTRVYGTDGSTSGQTVTVHISFDDGFRFDYDAVVFAGRVVARRPSRDERVRLTGAIIISGGFGARGGSVKSPALAPQPGTILEVRDVPAGHADVTAKGVTIISSTVDRAALAAERAALLARLAEIDALLT